MPSNQLLELKVLHSAFRFCADKYYHFFAISLVLFILTMLKHILSGYLFDANDSLFIAGIYGLCVFSFLFSCGLLFVISILLLFVKEGRVINKLVLMLVPTFIVVLFLGVMLAQGPTLLS